MKHETKNSKAFTLIELMVTIAIVGILASAVLTSLSGQRKRARMSNALRTAEGVLPTVTDCYMRGNFVGHASSDRTQVSVGSTFCSGGAVIAPPTGCDGGSYPNVWLVYYDSFWNPFTGTVAAYCDSANDQFFTRCHFTREGFFGKCIVDDIGKWTSDE